MKLYFSEPLNTAPSVKITMDGVVYQPTVTITGNARTTGTITMPTNFKAGTHTIEVSGGADYEAYQIYKVTKNFTYVEDTTPVVASVKDSTETSVTLKFNKPVSDLSSNAVAQYFTFSHTYSGSNAVTNSGSAFTAGSIVKVADDEYTVNFPTPFPPGQTKVYFNYKTNVADNNKVVDGYGNILAPFNFYVTTTEDTVAPTVDSVSFVDAHKVKVVFSEKVDSTTGANGAANASNYTLKDANGDEISVNSVANPSGDQKTFELSTDTINGGSHTLAIEDVKDLSVAQNEMADVTEGFFASDKVAPTVTSDAVVLGEKKIKIKFSEAMDLASITDGENYNVDSDVKITAVDGNKAVVLDYSDVSPAVDFTSGGSTTILVGQVKDAAGNKTSNFSTGVTVTHTTPYVEVDSVEVTALNKVKVTLDGVVTGLTSSDFAVKVTSTSSLSATGGWEQATIYSTTVVDGQTIVVLSLPTSVNAANTELPSGSMVAVATGSVATNDLTQAAVSATNSYGAAVNLPMTLADDKVGPTVVSRTTSDVDADGHIDTMTVVFSEDLYAGSVDASDFTVDGYSIKGVKSIVTNTVTLSLDEKSAYDTAATPKVQVVGSVEDVLGNASNAETTSTVASDGANPIMVSATATAADKLTITYSENVSTTTAGPTDWVLDTNGATAGGTVITQGVAATDGTASTIVLTMPASTFTTGTALADATVTYTQSGNDIDDGVTATAGNAALTPQTITGVKSGF